MNKTDARKELDALEARKAELEKILAESEVDPREWIGKLCYFWEGYEDNSIIRILAPGSGARYTDTVGTTWAHCHPVTLADLEGKIYQPKKTRYDWSRKDIPEWIRFIATDEDFGVYGYDARPVNDGISGWRYKARAVCLNAYLDGSCPDWRDSLEERPEGV